MSNGTPTTRRYPRSLADAFPDVRRQSFYLDTSLRARIARVLRGLLFNPWSQR